MKRRRSAFTLVELLVVITIIAMLVALLFPVFGTIRELANQTTCINRQKELANAIHLHEQESGFYPGYQSLMTIRQGGRGQPQTIPVSWVVPLLKTIRESEYNMVYAGGTPSQSLSGVICPSDSHRMPWRLGYVVNAGMQDVRPEDTNPPDWPQNGVFHFHSMPGGPIRSIRMTANHIRDGADRTLMLSENLQATQWWNPNYDFVREDAVGMVWWADPKVPEFPDPPTRMINRGKNDMLSGPDYNYARPSSNHPDGVIVTFAGGNSQFLHEDVNYAKVFARMMTTDGQQARYPGTERLVPEIFRGAPEDETD